MISAVWRGERPLWELFWLWYLLGGAIVAVACIAVAFFVLRAIEPTVLPWLTLFVGPVLTIPYQVIVIVGTVRAAVRAETPWRYLALGCIGVFLTLAPLVMLFVPFAIKW
jgi:hypothetical protein